MRQAFLVSSNAVEFGLSYYQYEDKHYIWLKELLCRDDEGKPYFRIVGELVITDLNDDEYVAMLYCTIEGSEQDNKILATGYYIEPIEIETIRFEIRATRAWMINWQTFDFEEIPAGNVICIDPAMP